MAHRWGFRAKLTALIAVVFILGSTAVLGVQLLLVRQLLEAETNTVAERIGIMFEPHCGPGERDAIPARYLPHGMTAEVISSAPGAFGEDELHVGWPEDTDEGIYVIVGWGVSPEDPAAARVMSLESFTQRGVELWITDQDVIAASTAPHIACLVDGDAIRFVARDLDVSPEERIRAINEYWSESTRRINNDVLQTLLVFSGGVLAASAALAVLAAWWLSKRSLGRIARITAATRAIDPSDLHQRLNLPGPADEIKELGDTIDGMLARIEDAFTRQDRFIAGASHELRTPLTITRTMLEIPLEQGLVPPSLEPDVRSALAANERSAQLVAALLTLARSRRGVTPAEAGSLTTDLVAVARELMAERIEAIAARNLQVGAPPSGEVLAPVSRDLVMLAVGNLLDNAICHNRDGGRIEITAGVGPFTPDAWIEVANDGPDLTEIDVDTLKEPFHRGSRSRLSGEGLGLGLALVETVANVCEGTLTLRTRPSGGLIARLTLPAA
ncbi:MAG: HAMP domain-containing histidine kinase [Promicromonosporaceae bacterium]|nr:HAMP domain-containing histidine kinase [Promicromonosporaceae bacterium]